MEIEKQGTKIENRELVLKHMVKHDLHSERDVNEVLELYYSNPQKVLNRIALNR